MSLGKDILKDLKDQDITLCDDFTERIKRTKNYGTLCSMYFKGDDWSLRNDFPGIKLCRIHKEGIQRFNMFVDSRDKYLNLHKAAFLGESDSSIEFNAFNIGSLIVRHQAKLKILAKDNSIVYLTCLDQADLNIEVRDSASVIVYGYGPDLKIQSLGNIKIIKRNGFSSI